MNLWLVLPFYLGQIVFAAAWLRVSPESINRVGPEIVVPPGPSPVLLRPPWPWPVGPPWTIVRPSRGTTVSTSAGSQNLVDLQSFKADDPQQAIQFAMGANESIKIEPAVLTGPKGFMFFLGQPNIVAAWTLLINNVSKTFRAQLSPEVPLSIPITSLVGPIALTANPNVPSLAPTLGLFEASMWSDEFYEPTHGHYSMQLFLDFTNSFCMHLSNINSTFTITHMTSPSVTYNITLMAPITGSLNPESLLDIMVAALDTAGIDTSTELVPNLSPYDDEDPNFLHISKWAFTNKTNFDYVIGLPSLEPNTSATALVLGLYDFDGLSNSTIVNNFSLVKANGPEATTTYTPGLVIIQWPVGYTYKALAAPGSADVDGAVRLYDSNDNLLRAFSPGTTRLYAPNSFVTATGALLWAQSTEMAATISIDVTANYVHTVPTSESMQTLSIRSLTLEARDSWLAFLNVYGETPVYIILSNGTNNISVLDGQLDSLFTVSDFVATLDEATGSLEIITGSLGLVVPLEINICTTNSLSTSIAVIQFNIVFGQASDTIVRYTLEDAADVVPIYFREAASLRFDGWAGGGGSLLNISPVKYGGASSKVSTVIDATAAIHRLDVTVGPKGRRDNDVRCTGGSQTVVFVDLVQLFCIGGGGGAAVGSHGGVSGGPVDPDAPRLSIAYPGFSGSFEPFNSDLRFFNQVEGPTAKPNSRALFGGLPETIQGSGSSAAQNGAMGFTSSGTQTYPNDSGGLGATASVAASGLPEPSIRTSGGTGALGSSTAVRLFGGGGGGATDWYCAGSESFDVTSTELTPAWTSDLIAGPIGGSRGPRYDPGPPYYAGPDYYYCDTQSILFRLFDELPLGSQNALVTSLLNTSLQAIGGPQAIFTQDISAITIDPFAPGFVISEPIVNDANIVSLVPVGPHDSSLPSTTGSNVRTVGLQETILFDNNTIICIINDGQVYPELTYDVLNTPFTGSGVPPGTIVKSIRFGPSVPNNVYSSIYLTLSKSIQDDLGPFNWVLYKDFAKEGLYFSRGINFYTQNLNSPNKWIQSVPITDSNLIDGLYTTMIHAYLGPRDLNDYYEGLTTFPSVEYFDQIWPANISVRAFIKPFGSINTGPPTTRTYESFTYTAGPQSFTVPSNVRSITIHAYGAGGTSLGALSGLPGQYARSTFTNLAGKTLSISVGQGGGQTKIFNYGGLTFLGQSTLGGGASFVTVTGVQSQTLISAAGGASGGTLGPGVGRPSSIIRSTNVNINQFDTISGAGGGPNGLSGQKGLGGTSGTSVIGRYGFSTSSPVGQPYYTNTVAFGSRNLQIAGNGLVVIEFTF